MAGTLARASASQGDAVVLLPIRGEILPAMWLDREQKLSVGGGKQKKGVSGPDNSKTVISGAIWGSYWRRRAGGLTGRRARRSTGGRLEVGLHLAVGRQ